MPIVYKFCGLKTPEAQRVVLACNGTALPSGDVDIFWDKIHCSLTVYNLCRCVYTTSEYRSFWSVNFHVSCVGRCCLLHYPLQYVCSTATYLILSKRDSWIKIKNFFLLMFSWGWRFITETFSRVYEYVWCVILYSLYAYVGIYKWFSSLFHDIVTVILWPILVTFLPFYNFKDTYCLLWSPDSCVRIMTVLCTGRLRHRISIPGRSKRFLSSLKRPFSSETHHAL